MKDLRHGESNIMSDTILRQANKAMNPPPPPPQIITLKFASLRDIPTEQFEKAGTGVYVEKKGHHLWSVEKDGDGSFMLTRNKEEADFDSVEPVTDTAQQKMSKVGRRAQNDDWKEIQCAYCGRAYDSDQSGAPPEDYVPSVDDDTAWAELAKWHSPGCEWVETRAHQREARTAQNLITSPPPLVEQPNTQQSQQPEQVVDQEKKKKEEEDQRPIETAKRGKILFGSDWEDFEVTAENQDGSMEIMFPKDQHIAKFTQAELEGLGVRWAKVKESVDDSAKSYYINYYSESPSAKGYGQSLVKDVKALRDKVVRGIELERVEKDPAITRKYWKKMFNSHGEGFVRGARKVEIEGMQKKAVERAKKNIRWTPDQPIEELVKEIYY